MSQIPTVATPARVPLDGGAGYVEVRQPRRSELSKIATAVNYVQGNTASEMAFGIMLARVAIVHGDDVRGVKCGTTRIAGVGRAVSEEYIDALSEDELARVSEVATGGDLTEDQAGK